MEIPGLRKMNLFWIEIMKVPLFTKASLAFCIFFLLSACSTIINDKEFKPLVITRSFNYIGSRGDYLYFDASGPKDPRKKRVRIHRKDFLKFDPDLQFSEYPINSNQSISVARIFSKNHEIFDDFYNR